MYDRSVRTSQNQSTESRPEGFDCMVAIVNLDGGVYSDDSLGMVVDV
ncbi:MAG: hypothetical protein V3U69_05990 [Bacteroidota bacterium]